MNETVLNEGVSAPSMRRGKTSYDTISNVGGHTETVQVFIASRDYSASYNIPPTSSGIIVYMKQGLRAEHNYVIEPLKFGLLPEWAKPTNPQAVKRGGDLGPAYSREVQMHQSKYFNCRKETISQDKSVWTVPRNSKRCVVPIQGYFEWQKNKSDKKPYFVYLKKSPLMFLAGLYSHNVNYNDTELVSSGQEYFSSFSIATGPSTGKGSNDLSWLHPRKPIFLKPNTAEWFEWLDPGLPWTDDLLDTALNCDTNVAYEDITTHHVSNLVGNPSYKGPEAIREEKVTQKSISQFFSPSPKKEKADTQTGSRTQSVGGEINKRHLPVPLIKSEERSNPLKRRLSGEENSTKKTSSRFLGSENYILLYHRNNCQDEDEDEDDEDEDEDKVQDGCNNDESS